MFLKIQNRKSKSTVFLKTTLQRTMPLALMAQQRHDSIKVTHDIIKVNIVSPDPFFDNGWNETIHEIRAEGYDLYVIMDLGGYESNLQGFIEYFSDCIDGIHLYNPLDFSHNPFEVYDLYQNARELAHSYDKTFIATVAPGFNNTAVNSNVTNALEHAVDRLNGTTYNWFWLIAKAAHPDGYAITSFNEWHEGTEIEPSTQYGNQYINLTRDNIAESQSTAVSACSVTFTESDLSSGVTWWVDLNGDNQSSTSDIINFSLPNGTYTYSTGASGYRAFPSTGSVTMNDANVNEQVTFSAIPEFPSIILLPILIIATLLTDIAYRRKAHAKKSRSMHGSILKT